AKRRGVPGLGPEPGERHRILRAGLPEHLDGHSPAERDIGTAPHLAERASGDLLVKPVTARDRSTGVRHSPALPATHVVIRADPPHLSRAEPRSALAGTRPARRGAGSRSDLPGCTAPLPRRARGACQPRPPGTSARWPPAGLPDVPGARRSSRAAAPRRAAAPASGGAVPTFGHRT